MQTRNAKRGVLAPPRQILVSQKKTHVSPLRAFQIIHPFFPHTIASDPKTKIANIFFIFKPASDTVCLGNRFAWILLAFLPSHHLENDFPCPLLCWDSGYTAIARAELLSAVVALTPKVLPSPRKGNTLCLHSLSSTVQILFLKFFPFVLTRSLLLPLQLQDMPPLTTELEASLLTLCLVKLTNQLGKTKDFVFSRSR